MNFSDVFASKVSSSLQSQFLKLSAFIFLCFANTTGFGDYFNVRGSPSTSLSLADLTAGAGSNLLSSKSDSALVQYIDVFPPSNYSNVTWEVDVQLSGQNSTWPANLAVYARRVNTGSPANSSIQGGGGFVLLSTSAQSFFTGMGNANGVTIQYLITNVSLANCPPGNYSLSVTYLGGLR